MLCQHKKAPIELGLNSVCREYKHVLGQHGESATCSARVWHARSGTVGVYESALWGAVYCRVQRKARGQARSRCVLVAKKSQLPG